MNIPGQYWIAVTDNDGQQFGPARIACSRCGHSPQYADHTTGCPRCGPVYDILETLMADVAAIKERLNQT